MSGIFVTILLRPGEGAACQIARREVPSDTVVSLQLGAEHEVTVILPQQDDEAALAVLDRLTAAIDNAASAVRLRQQARELPEQIVGFINPDGSGDGDWSELGAGASVEAYRG